MRNLRHVVLGLMLAVSAHGQTAEHQMKGLTCGSCHAAQAKPQPGTPMGQALQTAGNNALLASHPDLTLQAGAFRYRVETRSGQSTYSVTDGEHTITAPIRWAFGLNTQTFVFERNGQYFESLVSYYSEVGRLDTTIGDQAVVPQTVEQAFGRPLSQAEVTACFGCHSSNSVHDNKLTLATLQPGVTCDHCHAGASAHANSMTNPKFSAQERQQAIPARLGAKSAEATSAFCGQCHRTWETVVRNNWFGEMNVRFQPYRLASSKCYDGADQRISCTACHNPHENLVAEAKAYDSKCLACHATAGTHLETVSTGLKGGAKIAPACPVSQENCSSCHMPKVKLPGGHQTFSDHKIRVVHAGEAYPN